MVDGHGLVRPAHDGLGDRPLLDQMAALAAAGDGPSADRDLQIVRRPLVREGVGRLVRPLGLLGLNGRLGLVVMRRGRCLAAGDAGQLVALGVEIAPGERPARVRAQLLDGLEQSLALLSL